LFDDNPIFTAHRTPRQIPFSVRRRRVAAGGLTQTFSMLKVIFGFERVRTPLARPLSLISP
jgi:hypothetical protein